MSELDYQLLNWYYFNCSVAIYQEQQSTHRRGKLVHRQPPISAQGMGGVRSAVATLARFYRRRRTRASKAPQAVKGQQVRRNLRPPLREFTYANGVRVNSQCRHQPKCENPCAKNSPAPRHPLSRQQRRCYANDYKGETIWATAPPSDHKDMTLPGRAQRAADAILNGKKINNAYYVAESTMTCILGRMASYSGKDVSGTPHRLPDSSSCPTSHPNCAAEQAG